MRIETRILLVALSVAPGAFAQAGCVPAPVLSGGAFNTTIASHASYGARIPALTIGAAQWESAAVLSRFPASFQSFRTKIRVQSFDTPGPSAGPVCRNACIDQIYVAQSLDSSDIFELPLYKWVQFCSLTPTSYANGYACSQLPLGEYQACLAAVCPFLSGALSAANNPSCEYCLADVQPGESTTSRVFRCSATYDPDAAALCGTPSMASWWFWFVTSF